MYATRMVIDRNWRKGRYTVRTLFVNPHAESIYCVQFSPHPHSSLLVSGSRDATVKAWDMSTGRCLRTYRYHSGSVLCLQFEDEDDEEGLLVSGSSDGDIVLWELATGKRRMVLKGHRDSVLGVRFVGELLASCSKDRTIKLWSTVTGQLLHTLEGHRRAVNAIQIESDHIVSASGDREIRIWNFEGQCVRCIEGHERGIAAIQCLGSTIVSGGSDCSIRIFDNSSNGSNTINPVPLFGGGHTDLVRTLQFDDRWIVSGSYDETIKIWDRKTRKLLVNIVHAHAHRIFRIQYDITKIVSCSQDQKIYIWDFGHNADVSFMAF
ncbi:WD40 repeat-like protein [Atractiella rhizophila]|nr:WD40 repeat-like protein [Atractiella rhizophila]